jgi:hypothetical protein
MISRRMIRRTAPPTMTSVSTGRPSIPSSCALCSYNPIDFPVPERHEPGEQLPDRVLTDRGGTESLKKAISIAGIPVQSLHKKRLDEHFLLSGAASLSMVNDG